jgi:Protein of unknown function (DUF1207)
LHENAGLLSVRPLSAKHAFPRISVWCLLLAGVLACDTTADAQSADNEQRPPTWTLDSGTTLTLFPSADVYPVPVADPLRPTTTIAELFYSRVSIEDTSTPRTALTAGGRFGMLRIAPSSPDGRSWQVSITGGLHALFDSQKKNDAIGWEGNYGFALTTASGGPLALKVALQHLSSHLGDEYVEHTGRQRINYDRGEVAFGGSVRLSHGWRPYVEACVGYVNRAEGQEPWRGQAGVKYESRPSLWGGRFAWYGATNVAAWQERAWRVDTAVQGGLLTRTHGRIYRIAAGFTDGRPTVSEFFQHSERWFTVGFYIDL